MDVNATRTVAPTVPTRTTAATEAPQPATTAPAASAAPPAFEEGEAPAPQVSLAWNPVDVDLSQVDTNVDQPPMWDYGNKPIQGRTFTTWGDPHEITGDGGHFDNQKHGEFVKLMSASGDFIIQTRQESWVKNPQVCVNAAAAVKLGDDLVVYDMNTKLLTVNGEEYPLQPGQEFKLPGGGQVKVNADSIEMMSPKGDSVRIDLKDSYINVTGEVAASRKDGEIRGSLGAFDNDTDASNDLMGRFGKNGMGSADNAKQLDAFLEIWRASGGESLFRRSEDLNFFNQFDGKELVPAMKDYFLKYYDLNGDGAITKNEFLSAKAAHRAIGYDDFNNDGVITSKEMNDDLRKYDRDKDGKVTAHEYLLYSMGWDILKSLREDFEAEQAKRAAKAAEATTAGKPAFPPPRPKV